MRKLLFFVGALIAASIAAAQPRVISPSDLSAVAELRMLSQQVAKAYVQVGLEVAPAAALGQLQDSILRFERGLERAHDVVGASTGGSAVQERVAVRWAALRRIVDEPADRGRVAEASARSIDLLESADELTREVERMSGQTTTSWIARAGRLRMLAQRVAKAYLLYSWAVDSERSRLEMETAAGELGNTLDALLSLPETDAQTRTELAEIALQWEWLRTALATDAGLSYRLVVAEAADALVTAVERLVRLKIKSEP